MLAWLIVAALASVLVVRFTPNTDIRRQQTWVMVILVVVIGTLVGLGATWLEEGLWPVAFAMTLLLFIAVASTVRWIRFDRLLRRVEDPATRPGALHGLQEHLFRSRRRRGGRALFAQQSFVAARTLGDLGMVDEAIDILTDIPDRFLYAIGRAGKRIAIGHYRLRAGDIAGARELLLGFTHQAPEAYRDSARVNEALLLVLDRDPQGARALLGTEPPRRPARIRSSWWITMSHIEAADGRADESRAALREAAAVSSDSLDRARSPRGPASALAEGMQTRNDSPFR